MFHVGFLGFSSESGYSRQDSCKSIDASIGGNICVHGFTKLMENSNLQSLKSVYEMIYGCQLTRSVYETSFVVAYVNV